MRLVDGQTYETQNGIAVKVKDHADGTSCPFRGSNNFWYRPNGESNIGSCDLILKEIPMSFDLTKFVAELSKSTNICAGAKADIQRAADVAGGKILKPVLKRGQVWTTKYDGIRLIVVNDTGNLISMTGTGLIGTSTPQKDIDTGNYTFVAESLKDYIAAGGSL